jgi:hypothetical protein
MTGFASSTSAERRVACARSRGRSFRRVSQLSVDHELTHDCPAGDSLPVCAVVDQAGFCPRRKGLLGDGSPLRPCAGGRFRLALGSADGKVDRQVPVPGLSRYKLDKLTPRDVQRFLAGLRGKLAPASVVKIHGVLRVALSDAERLDLVPRNVAKAPPDQKASHTLSILFLRSPVITGEAYRPPIRHHGNRPAPIGSRSRSSDSR